MTNISKYVQLNDFLLLEYEFNKDGSTTSLTTPKVVTTTLGTKEFFEGNAALGGTNNILPLTSMPVNANRTNWFLDASDYATSYPIYWDSSVSISTTQYPYDKVKVHIVSGYNFDDIAGFLLQIRAARNIPEIDKIVLSGTSGTANILCNGITMLATFDGSLGNTGINFVVDSSLAFSSVDAFISLDASNNIIFTSQKGVPFIQSPKIINVTGNLFGTVYRTQIASTMFVDRDLANFTYAKQPQTFGNTVVKFSPNTLFLGNRFYDKYVEFAIPSIQELGGDTTTNLGQTLDIAGLSDVYVTYSSINEVDLTTKQFVLDEQINVQLPVTSVADNFNCFIAESTNGDYIEYYATWNGDIIGDWIGDIESGRIKLYTSNNPNDNYQEFTDTYGTGSRKWVIIHEISVYEQLGGGTSLLTQKFSFTQDGQFSQPNFFRPILQNADIDSTYTIQYTCRLTNRMDGTQIIRKASFASSDPKKYGLWFTRLTVENLIPYKVFNRLEAEAPNIKGAGGPEKIKYVKVFYDTTTVVMNYANEIFPQGTGPLFLKSFDSVYKFKFEKIDVNGDRVNVDLSGAFNYAIQFKLDDNNKIEVGPTYSTNMNTTLGEIEFKLTEDQLSTLKKQTNNNYSIIVKNPNGTSYTFYEGTFYDISNEEAVITQYQNMYTVTDLQAKNAELQAEVQKLTDELATHKAT